MIKVKSRPTISVIIPCYNEEGTISRCLDALINQKEFIHEVIVVDNNSTDGTVDVIKSYGKEYPFIRLESEKKQGVQFARNRGFDVASGDILARIDVDTIVEKEWADKLRGYYGQPKNASTGAASGRSRYYDLPFPKLTALIANAIIYNSNQAAAGTFFSLYGANMSLRRDAWKKIRADVCMRAGIMEDIDVGYHVLQAGYEVHYIPEVKAAVSGRRMRMSPLRYWKYNRQWWMTYRHHGLVSDARRVRVMVWFGNILQAAAWVGLLFHDPNSNRFSLIPRANRENERVIP